MTAALPPPEVKQPRLALTRKILLLIVVVLGLCDLVSFNFADHLGCRSRLDWVKHQQAPTNSANNYALPSPNEIIAANLKDSGYVDLCESDYYTCRHMATDCGNNAWAWAAHSKIDLFKYSFTRPWWSIPHILESWLSWVGACLKNFASFIGFLFKVDAWSSAAFWLVPLIIAEGFIHRAEILARAGVTQPGDATHAIAPPLSRIGQESAHGDAGIATGAKVHAALTQQRPSFADEQEFDE